MPKNQDTTILFWNLGRRDNPRLVAGCIEENGVDIAVFAEWGSLNLAELRESLSNSYVLCQAVAADAKVILVAKADIDVSIHREQSRYTLYRLTFGPTALILAGVHLEDKRSHPEPYARHNTIRYLMRDLGEACEDLRCEDAVIIGDFNMEPYDDLVVVPDGFNAVFFKDVIRRQPIRTWEGRNYGHLYSPMLCNFSEEGPQYGSFYCSNNDVETYWHCFDQVLVTAGLAEAVVEVRHVRHIGGTSLLSCVGPNKKFSDHLPLLVKLSASGGSDGE